MSIQEKKVVVNIITTIGLYIAYLLYVKAYFLSGIQGDLQLWGKSLLIFIPIVIGVKIVSNILFFILNAIFTKGLEMDDREDERDKLFIKNSNNVGYIVVSIGFIISLISLVLLYPAFIMINIIFLFFNIAEISSDIYKLILYKRG